MHIRYYSSLVDYEDDLFYLRARMTATLGFGCIPTPVAISYAEKYGQDDIKNLGSSLVPALSSGVVGYEVNR